jgi:hypothetical protein
MASRSLPRLASTNHPPTTAPTSCLLTCPPFNPSLTPLSPLAQVHGISLSSEIGFDQSSTDNGAHFLSPSISHMDCIHWVKRDSYLPAGSHGLKAVCRAKLG